MTTLTRGFDFRPIDRKDIPREGKRGHRPSRYLATLGEFMRSGAQSVELFPPNRQSATRCMAKRINEAGLAGKVRCYSRQGRVFLERVTP